MPLLFQNSNATPFQAQFERDLFDLGVLSDDLPGQNLPVLAGLVSFLYGHITKEDLLEGLTSRQQEGLLTLFRVYDEYFSELPPFYQELSDVTYNSEDTEIPENQLFQPFTYPDPPNSPTNQEMHAMNGNLSHQHNNSYGDFIRGAARGLRPGAHSSDRFAAGALAGSLGVGGSLAYTSFQDMRPGLTEAYNFVANGFRNKKNKPPGPSNSDMHSYNGNIKTLQPKTPVYVGAEKHKGKLPKWDWNPQEDQITKPIFEKISKGVNPATILDDSGPSNSEMHSYNGNIKPRRIGPITQKQHERVLRRRLKRKAKKTLIIEKRIPRPQQNKKTIAKSLPAGTRGAAVIESKEKRQAQAYTKFLKNPVFEPPRLGSTGNTPTLLVHGYFRKTYTMATPGVGTVANATCVTATINPVLFSQVTNDTTYVSPIVINFTTAGTVVPTVGNATGAVSPQDFTNTVALKNQVLGTTTIDLASPLARWVGGAVTLTCRCPMTTTAPPFMFGGLLPEYPSSNDVHDTIKVDSQISSFAIDNIKNLSSTVELPGFTVSSVYAPNTPTALQFNPHSAKYSSTIKAQPITSIPYVGMTNCPTAAVIEITVSSWFEVQQNTYYAGGATVSTADYGGWRIGPKLSCEDIYDHIPRFNTVTTKMIGMGAKGNGSTSSYNAMMVQQNALEQPPPKTLAEEIADLKKQVSLLSVKVDDDDFDEKHFSPKSPKYSNLTKSTLDLAMSIKKSLSPSAV